MTDTKSLRILYTALLVLVIAPIAAVVAWIVDGSGGGVGLPHAYAALKTDAKRGGKLRKAPGGLSAWQDPTSPTSVYLAKPGAWPQRRAAA